MIRSGIASPSEPALCQCPFWFHSKTIRCWRVSECRWDHGAALARHRHGTAQRSPAEVRGACSMDGAIDAKTRGWATCW